MELLSKQESNAQIKFRALHRNPMKWMFKINSRITEPILLGSVANLIINIIFNPNNPGVWWSKTEFVVAILFCLPITETNRYVEKKMEKKYKNAHPFKLFIIQLTILSLVMLLVLNVVGRIYHWAFHDDFYSLGELFIINLIVFFVGFILVFFRWAIKFYKKWQNTEEDLVESKTVLNEMSSDLKRKDETIILRRSNEDCNVKISEIKTAYIEFGIVKVLLSKDEFYVFDGSLTALFDDLPKNLFFLVTRNIILHRDSITSISSSSYGKVLLKTSLPIQELVEITVSRPKASSFRKWYHIT